MRLFGRTQTQVTCADTTYCSDFKSCNHLYKLFLILRLSLISIDQALYLRKFSQVAKANLVLKLSLLISNLSLVRVFEQFFATILLHKNFNHTSRRT